MSDTVIVALCSLLGSGVGSLCSFLGMLKLVNHRLGKLENHDATHFKTKDRVTELEVIVGGIDKRVEKLEK